MKLEFFLTDFSKNIKMSNLLKIRSVGVVMFHAAGGGGGEGRTDRRRPDRYDAVNRRFSQSCESAPPKKKNLLALNFIAAIKSDKTDVTSREIKSV